MANAIQTAIVNKLLAHEAASDAANSGGYSTTEIAGWVAEYDETDVEQALIHMEQNNEPVEFCGNSDHYRLTSMNDGREYRKQASNLYWWGK